MWHGKLKTLATGIMSWWTLYILLAILFITAVYLFIFPSPTLPYIAAVLVHAAIGVLAVLFLVPRLVSILSFKKLVENSGWLAISAGGVVGIYLLYIGTSRSHWSWMYA